ncbi:hypothetical protein SR41_04685 [Sphingomonas melonis]|uniref:DNA-directed RNA polymerase n=1 Tax=Sphingomonas melonis TaxID=152682 RepID=A0A0D1K6Q3_9SPHN|nr:DNA-directed RNA polymerase [Sphingomonas melonis]KIU29308.1 hypothetical protein SR41_04685 [Sphingomonas melonis]
MTEITTALDLEHLLEEEAAAAGASKYLSAQKRKEETEGFGARDDVQKMLKGALPILSAGITNFVEASKGKKGRPHVALKSLTRLDPDVVALAALSVTFNRLGRKPDVSSIAGEIGRHLEIEIEGLRIVAAGEGHATKLKAKVGKGGRPAAARRKHVEVAQGLEVEEEWTRSEQVLVGGTVLNILLTDLAGIFERHVVTDFRGTTPSIKLTDAAAESLAVSSEELAWTMPILKPMVVQPRPWVRMDSGAYLDFNISKLVPLVRTYSREHKRAIIESIKSGAMTECLEGINAIQDTRFAIDERVLEVVEWARGDGKRPSRSFPDGNPPKKVEKLDADTWAAMDPAARSARARRSKAVSDAIQAAGADGGVFTADLNTAKLLTSVHAFYLPHNMDFRGRVYAVPHFNPQRSDHIKALFHFADAVPLGPDGGRWLMIHLANCGDFGKVSKKSMDDRVQWVRDNEADVIACAANPYATYGIWGEADSPFCFLQACFEYAAWKLTGYSEEFASTIAVALDGSCSGLQHYSAITRSAEEAYHVNLLPRETPGDIYNVVADAARPTLEAKANECEASARIVSVGFGRSDVKSNVMTYFYGSGKFGMRDQHMKQTMRPESDAVALGEKVEHKYALLTKRTNKETKEETWAMDGGFSCANILAQHVYAAVTSVAPKADEASCWFQSVAATLAHESLPVIWSTPVGLPVVQRYSEYLNKTVALWLVDRAVSVPTGHGKLDPEGNVLARVEVLTRASSVTRSSMTSVPQLRTRMSTRGSSGISAAWAVMSLSSASRALQNSAVDRAQMPPVRWPSRRFRMRP